MSLKSALDLPVPRNVTALLQHLQRLVGVEGHRQWCGGTIPAQKLAAFIQKMEQRYPICRNTRERSYDRQHGRAVVHLIVYPIGNTTSADSNAATVHDLCSADSPRSAETRSTDGMLLPATIAWWLVSGPGAGGLLDPIMPDAHVSRDAMSSDAHISFGDYVLLYATKKEPNEITDPRTGRTRIVLKDTSRWTFKLNSEVIKQIRTSIDECCNKLDSGPDRNGPRAREGLLSLLEAQRSRPLFSGVRSQILYLHKYARDSWRSRSSGSLLSMTDLLASDLPKMRRVRIWGDPPRCISDLLRLR